MKFGGTSVEDARAFERARRVVAAREAERPVVVVSAMGGFTDALLEAVGAASGGAPKRRRERSTPSSRATSKSRARC